MNQREDREIMASSELDWDVRLTYQYLWMSRDWYSCVVGDADKKMISYQAIRERLEFTPKPRSNYPKKEVGRDRVKRILRDLLDLGAIVRLDGQRYGRELRFFLPWASPVKVSPQDARHMRATNARHSSGQHGRDLDGYARHTEKAHARHTSIVNTLSHKYIYYCPDDADWSWLRYMAGHDVCDREYDRNFETEKFNLRNRTKTNYDHSRQREDWRIWMVRSLEHKDKRA